jgi:hypothetical protein
VTRSRIVVGLACLLCAGGVVVATCAASGEGESMPGTTVRPMQLLTTVAGFHDVLDVVGLLVVQPEPVASFWSELPFRIDGQFMMLSNANGYVPMNLPGKHRIEIVAPMPGKTSAFLFVFQKE